MKVSLKWLHEYLQTDIAPAELARRITLAGVEVGSMLTIGDSWAHVLVGEVTEVNPHPNADRLRLVTVNLGIENQTVVCGAPNVEVGQRIAFAHAGARLLDAHTGETVTLKPAKIRGVLSAGMVCSEKELGISENHEGILVLPFDAPLGMPLTDYMGDTIFDLEVTPNRPDCLSVIGIARELAALTGSKLTVPEPFYNGTGGPIEEKISVEITNPELCPRYVASLITGVKIGESPRWMQERLLASGMRPINNVVDISNYVMLEYGQPLHTFDYSALEGEKIIVRRANPGEKIISLDGIERELNSDMLVIADVRRPVAVAGVMGGANSEVTGETTSILLEAASFKPTSIYYTARKLSMASEASSRFERGIRADLTLPALKRATQLFIEIAGGQAAAGIVDIYPGIQEKSPILLTVERVNGLLDTCLDITEIEKALFSLGFISRPDDSGTELLVNVPYWRSDINLPVDLVEEVARVIGYDKIPMTMLSQPIPQHDPDPMVNLKRSIRQILAGYGFQEIITFSLTNMDALKKVGMNDADNILRLVNPMTADLEYLRPTLRANVLMNLSSNRRFSENGIMLFELGRVYHPQMEQLPAEIEMACGVINGIRGDKSWYNTGEPVDFYDIKGVVEDLMDTLKADYELGPSQDEILHPVRQASLLLHGYPAGVFGELHPRIAQAFEISGPTLLFELNMALLLPACGKTSAFVPIPRFPAVIRDLALILDIGVTNEQVIEITRGFPLIKKAEIFDVYSGKQVSTDKKSLAYRLTFLSPSHTLTDVEVNSVLTQLTGKLSRDLGATLRA